MTHVPSPLAPTERVTTETRSRSGLACARPRTARYP